MFGTVSENADEVDNQMQTDEARRTIPSLFSALSARNWSRAEQLIDVGEGINFQKVCSGDEITTVMTNFG